MDYQEYHQQIGECLAKDNDLDTIKSFMKQGSKPLSSCRKVLAPYLDSITYLSEELRDSVISSLIEQLDLYPEPPEGKPCIIKLDTGVITLMFDGWTGFPHPDTAVFTMMSKNLQDSLVVVGRDKALVQFLELLDEHGGLIIDTVPPSSNHNPGPNSFGIIMDSLGIEPLKVKPVHTRPNSLAGEMENRFNSLVEKMKNTAVPQDETRLERHPLGLYNRATGFIFDGEFKVIGKLCDNCISPLTGDDLEICDYKGWRY